MANGFWYCAEHTLSATPTLTDYQVKVLVHYGTGTNAGDSVYCNSHCRGDFNDIRFEDSTGAALPHWREMYAEYDYAIFWVRMPTIDAATTLVIKYGNADAASESNPITTFVFFDDFAGTVLDGTKWSGGLHTVTYSVNSALRILGGDNYWVDDSGDTGSQIWSTWTPITNCKVIWKSTLHLAAAAEMGQGGIAFIDASNGVQAGNFHTDGDSDEIIAGCYGNIDTVVYDYNAGANDESRVFAITKLGDKYTLKHRVYGTDRWANDITHTIATAASRLALVVGKDSGAAFCSYIEIDWIYIRNYAAVEPADGAWTAEELLFVVFDSIYNILPEPSVDPANLKFYRSLTKEGGAIDLSHLQTSGVLGNEISRISAAERSTGTIRYVKQFLRNENDMSWGPVSIYISSPPQYSPDTVLGFALTGSKSMLHTASVLSGTAIFTATGFITTSVDLQDEVKAGECIFNSSDDTPVRAVKITTVASTHLQLESAYIGTLGSWKEISVAPATMSRFVAPVSSSDTLSPVETFTPYRSVGMWKRYEVKMGTPPFANDWFTVRFEEQD